MSAPRPDILRFGTFEVDVRSGELRKQGKRIKLQGQPFQVLAVLLQRPGDVVTREELRSLLWQQDTFVDFDDGLNTAISKIREALGDSADNPRFIETLPRRGYRFLGSVSGLETGEGGDEKKSGRETPSEPRRLHWTIAIVAGAVSLAVVALYPSRMRNRVVGSSAVSRIESLAVLPLTNLSGDPEQEYFADGMTDAVITDLAQLGSVRVISRTSVARYKKTDKSLPEIARELNVDGIVEGTVQRSGNRVRITAQLIEGRTDRHAWAQSYERDLQDVLALQDEIARAIADEIKIKVTPQEQAQLRARRTVNSEAYELYLRGLAYSIQHEDQPKLTAVDYFNRAIQIDPNWAAPYAQIALAYLWIGSDGYTEFYPKSKAAALKAIQLDEGVADAHGALAFVLHNYDWDWQGAEREYKRALELNPNSSGAHAGYALLLIAAGRSKEAANEMQRAEELDPDSPTFRKNLGVIYSCGGEHALAIEQLQNAAELDPTSAASADARFELGMAYLRKAKYAEAVAELERVHNMKRPYGEDLAGLAQAYAAAGQREKAMKILKSLEEKEANGEIVASGWDGGLYPIYFSLGQKEQGLAWLQKAYNKRSDSLVFLRCWPGYEGMRTDPRFADLVSRVGIPQ